METVKFANLILALLLTLASASAHAQYAEITPEQATATVHAATNAAKAVYHAARPYRHWAAQQYADKWAAADQRLMRARFGQCKMAKGETPAEEAKMEQDFFPFAADKLKKMNKCEVNVMNKLVQAGYKSKFIQKTAKDIAVKLPTLQRLHQDLVKQTKIQKELNAEEFALSAQLARVGYIAPYQEVQRKERLAKLKKVAAVIADLNKKRTALVGTLWRNDDPVMQAYVTALESSDLTPEEYYREALVPNQGIVHRKVWGSLIALDNGAAKLNIGPGRLAAKIQSQWGGFSLLDSVVKTMANESSKLTSTLDAQYIQTPKGRKFEPNWNVRAVLAGNVDMVYDLDDDGVDPKLKTLQCNLNQKYDKGADVMDQSIAAGFMLMPVGEKAVSFAFEGAEKLFPTFSEWWNGSRYIRHTVNAFEKYGTIAERYGQANVWKDLAEDFYKQCVASSWQRLSKQSNDECDEDTSIDDIEDHEATELDKQNCGMFFISAAMTFDRVQSLVEVASRAFEQNPRLMARIEKIQNAMEHDRTQHILTASEKKEEANARKDQANDITQLVQTNNDATYGSGQTTPPAGTNGNKAAK